MATSVQSAQGSKTIADFAPELPRPAVVCTIVKIAGSAPQEVGARMWVTAERFLGTLGGGELERRALARARELLADAKAKPRLEEFVLCKALGQCCGGRVEVFFEPVRRRKSVHLFGGGHVGRALAQILSQTPFEVRLVDSRPQWGGPEGLPADIIAECADPLAYAASRAWNEKDAICVFTHSHDLDFELVKRFLPTSVGYLGLIGSEHKADVFQARLRALPGGEALAAAWERKVRCPMGAFLRGKNPKLIAVSIAAELIQDFGIE